MVQGNQNHLLHGNPIPGAVDAVADLFLGTPKLQPQNGPNPKLAEFNQVASGAGAIPDPKLQVPPAPPHPQNTDRMQP